MQRVGARLQCEGSRVRIPVRAWMLCLSGVGFSVLLCFLLLPFGTGMDCGKKSLLPMSSRATSFVLNWLTDTITKSNKSSNCHLSFFLSFLRKFYAILRKPINVINTLDTPTRVDYLFTQKNL